MNERDSVRLRHMLDAAHSALSFVQDRTRDDLDRDEMLVFAVTKAVEIVGEAANQVCCDSGRAFRNTLARHHQYA